MNKPTMTREILEGKYRALLNELSGCRLKDRDRFLKIQGDVRRAFDELYFYQYSDAGRKEAFDRQGGFDWFNHE
jgi:hypothetical protein